MFFFHPRSRQFFFLSSFSIHILPRFSASPVIRRSPPYRTVNLPGLRVPLVQGFLMSAYSGLEICLYQLIAGYYCIGWQFKKKTANEAGGGKLWWIGCRGVSGLAVIAWGGGQSSPSAWLVTWRAVNGKGGVDSFLRCYGVGTTPSAHWSGVSASRRRPDRLSESSISLSGLCLVSEWWGEGDCIYKHVTFRLYISWLIGIFYL